MKYTLLELVQTILSSTDSDEVNSINDSTESQQVVKIVKTCYFDIVERADPPELYSIVTLDPSNDVTKPVLMSLPDTVESLRWLKYNKETVDETDNDFKEVFFLSLEQFLDQMHSLSESDDTVETFAHTVGSDTYTFMYTNDKAPTWYTSFNDNTIIFDSYDAEVDTTLQKAKTLGYGKLIVPFTETDSFVPQLDNAQFQLLLNESKALAWAELKQTQHAKAEQASKRQWTSLQRTKNAILKPTPFDRLPHFGRK